jgi:isocitrate dehydrogenase (NAD+)
MKHTITLIPGDGIGPEVSAAVVRIIEAAGADIQWETHYAGAQALEKFGETLPAELLESIKRNKIALKGPITTPVGKGFTSVNVGLRKALDLYANLRPVRALPNVPSRYPELDLVVVRENTEDLYSGIEHVVVPGVVESIKIITEKASTRIARFAFDYARRENRKKVTAVHKANIMKLSDGLSWTVFATSQKITRRLKPTTRLSTTPACSSSCARNSLTSCCWKICTATSSQTSAPASSTASALCLAQT